MIVGELSANGRVVDINIPESLREIPLSRFIPADIEYRRILSDYGDILFSTDYRYLESIVKFLGFVLDVDPNHLIGCKTGIISNNAKKVAAGLDASKKWDSVEGTLLALFEHVAGLFSDVNPFNADIRDFTINGKEYIIPDYLKKGLDYLSPNDLQTWQAVECAETQRLLAQYVEGLKSDDDEIELSSFTDEQIAEYCQRNFNAYLRIIASLLRPCDMTGLFDIESHITGLASELQDIDTQTAFDVFFSGLPIGGYYMEILVSSISSIAQDLQEEPEPVPS